jgi:hypothetical protein
MSKITVTITKLIDETGYKASVGEIEGFGETIHGSLAGLAHVMDKIMGWNTFEDVVAGVKP